MNPGKTEMGARHTLVFPACLPTEAGINPLPLPGGGLGWGFVYLRYEIV